LNDELKQGANDLHYGPADATATPTISCFIKIQIGLTFLVPACPGCPRKEAVKRVSVTFNNSTIFYHASKTLFIVITVPASG